MRPTAALVAVLVLAAATPPAPAGAKRVRLGDVTRRSQTDNIRPVGPRGLDGPDDTVVWLRGRYPGYRSFLTTVTTLRDFPAPPRIGRFHALGG